MRARYAVALILLCGVTFGCSSKGKSGGAMQFGDDVKFLQSHGRTIVLTDSSGKAKIAISPGLQGRVMTSTANGDNGASFGWINRQYFTDAAAGKTNPHISPYGGEDRFWMGPEGGQFSIFFAKGAEFNYSNWFTPKFIDTEPFETVSTTSNSATFRRQLQFQNYSGTQFDVTVDRTIRLISRTEAWRHLNVDDVEDVHIVAFESDNSITNTGRADWNWQSGLLSIWILGMFNATPKNVVAIPIQPGPENVVGRPVNDDYFGTVPGDRLKVVDNVVYFKADANYRSKIGIPPKRTQPIAGSYDPIHGILTIVQFSFVPSAMEYVNSAWKIQDNPYSGDVLNSYNDGPPPEPGKPQLGKFYEIESSSPAAPLGRGQSLRHVHRTIHLQGHERELDGIAKATLGVSLKDIQEAFKK